MAEPALGGNDRSGKQHVGLIGGGNGSARNAAAGIERDAFVGLLPEQLDLIVTLLARVGENAYRRGFQQGVTMAENRPETIRANLHGWRYGYQADDAPEADCNRISTSADRLFIEHPELRHLGLREPMADSIMPHSWRDDKFEARS